MKIHKQHRLTGRNSSGSHTCRAVHFIQNIWNRLSCVNRKSFWYSSPHLKAMYQFGQNYLWILTKIFWSNLATGDAFIHHEHEMKMLFQPHWLARPGVLKSENLCISGWNTLVIITGQYKEWGLGTFKVMMRPEMLSPDVVHCLWAPHTWQRHCTVTRRARREKWRELETNGVRNSVITPTLYSPCKLRQEAARESPILQLRTDASKCCITS